MTNSSCNRLKSENIEGGIEIVGGRSVHIIKTPLLND